MSEKTVDIRRRLPGVWGAFFSRFGRLTPVQQEVIPIILDHAGVMVVAPTGSGKTEAVLAPLLEIALREKWHGLCILYIVPTRALASDLERRIREPIADIGLVCGSKHGDKPNLRKSINVLVSTPESVDSLICRLPELFTSVCAVVIDEVHFTDGTYRGDQLRVLLRRLRRRSACPKIRTYLLSATVPNPEEVAGRYIDDAVVVNAGSQRAVQWYFASSLEELVALARSKSWRKILCFCNTRAAVEETSAHLSKLWEPYPVIAHHGSVSRHERKEAELALREHRNAICVASPTLEVGIDIGDIDAVALIEAPWSLASLQQRLGRANRRSGTIVAAAIARSDVGREIFRAMFDCISAGNWPATAYVPDLSVVVQQILSYLYERRSGAPEEELGWLTEALCSSSEMRDILHHLREHDFVEYKGGSWVATAKAMDLGEKGQIHSNVPDQESLTVVNVKTDKVLGQVSGFVDRVFLLGRRAWEVVAISGSTLYVKPYHGETSPACFQRRSQEGAFAWLLPPHLRRTERAES